MDATDFLIFFVVFLALEQRFLVAEVRWCENGERILENSFADNATQYNDELYVCMRCEQRVQLVLRDEMTGYECCNGDIAPVGTCATKDSCNKGGKCDGLRQCYDGQDEMGCYGCSNDSFGCDDPDENPRCLPQNKLCDSVKDCKDGRDETLCPYYGGWCKGYACGGGHPNCIEDNKVCDGIKDCLDGSDESSCQYCPNQFRCRVYFKDEIGATSAECVGRFRVCDGIKDCINGADERNCHRWQEWEQWSECGTVTESCTRIRRRACIDYKSVVVNSARCYDTGSSTLNENQIDICPICISNASTTTTLPTTSAEEGYSGYSGYSVTTVSTFIKKSGSANFTFDRGAQIAVAVAVSVFILAIIIGVLIAACKLKHTGFWRPSTKLPHSAHQSNVSGINISNRRRIKPLKISHPYPLKKSKKRKVPEEDQTHQPQTEYPTISIDSISFPPADQTTDYTKEEIPPADKNIRSPV